jgi:hypothetical protein
VLNEAQDSFTMNQFCWRVSLCVLSVSRPNVYRFAVEMKASAFLTERKLEQATLWQCAAAETTYTMRNTAFVYRKLLFWGY